MPTNLFSRIIVGIDGSEPSQSSLRFACRLAREHDGELVVCHAVADRRRERGAADLAAAAAEVKRAGLTVTERLADGDPADVLLRVAAELACGLIVMGTHGRSGVERLVVGSTTEAVLARATIPVLTLAPGARIAPPSRRCFERVAVGIDDSDAAGAAMRTAIAFPSDDRRELIVYSIAEGSADDSAYERALVVVQGAVALAHAQGAAAHGHVSVGKAHEALIGAANGIVHEGKGVAHVPSRVVESEADVIVIGSRGTRGAARKGLGSVAASVVRSAPLPVLVVSDVTSPAR